MAGMVGTLGGLENSCTWHLATQPLVMRSSSSAHLCIVCSAGLYSLALVQTCNKSNVKTGGQSNKVKLFSTHLLNVRHALGELTVVLVVETSLDGGQVNGLRHNLEIKC